MTVEMLGETEAEREAKLKPRTLRREHTRGTGPAHFVIGNRRYYRLAEVMDWLAERRVEPAAVPIQAA